jgi:hypothetical protein
MLCPECNHDNPPGYKFCGLCGASAGAVLAPATAARVWSPPAPARQQWPAEEPPGLAAMPASEDHKLREAAFEQDATRYLCAAVTLDPALEHKVLYDVLEEPDRAIVNTPGVDLVTVLKYALAAHRRRLIRDVFLLADLCALILSVFIVGSALLFLLLLVAAWLAVVAERFAGQHGPALHGLRPGAFAPRKAPSPGRNSYADKQLKRVAAASASGNVTVYSGFPPFVGYGRVRTSWSFVVDVTQPRRGATPRRFSVHEVYDHVKAGLHDLDLPGIEVSDRLFVNGRDIHHDRRFLPEPGRPPVTSVSRELIRELMANPEERARPYLTIGMTGWQGDLVVTMFVRFLLSRTDLFVEAAHTVVPPLREEFKIIDERDPAPTAGEFFGLLGRSAIGTLPLLLGSVPSIFRELAADARRERKRRRVAEAGDYGALLSVREAAADAHWHRYFQIFDDARYVKVIEQRIFRSLVEFLEDRGIDTSSLVSRTETLVNNGVMVTGGATVHADQIAAGAGAQAAGLISRIRGKEGGGSAGGEG